MLELTQIEKSYGGRRVLSVASMQLSKGIYWLQGANGSGKTTLLRMISGLIPFKGSIALDGCQLGAEPVAYRRKISWADAEPLYPPFLKGRELVDFYQEVRGASRAQVDSLTELFEVRSWLDAPVGTYSSGMIKKLSLVLAFIGDCSLIALDEPLVTLDKDCIPKLYSVINDRYTKKGTAFLISSHQELAREALPDERILQVSHQTLQLIA